MTRLFDVVLRLKPLQWQKILEDLRSIKGILSKVQLILFDGYTKEYCIATHLFARRVLSLVRRSGFLSTALYLKQCSSSLMIAYGGDRREPELLSVPVSLTRRGYPRIIPAFHCRVIYGGGPRADECVRFYLSVFSLYRIVILAKKISKNTFEPFITPIKDMDRVLRFVGDLKQSLPYLVARYIQKKKKFLFDLPLLEHHNIRPFGVNPLNGESIIRYPFSYFWTEWKKSNETCDGY